MAAAPEKKCHARKGLRFYVRRYNAHREKMGASTAVLPPAVGRCPLYLAKVWRSRALVARQQYELWWATRGSVIRALERGLAGTPMAGTGRILEHHGRLHGVSPYFMVAVAATESSIGHAACSNNRRNVWGLASCVNSWPVPYFDTWDEAIGFYADFLAERWPGHTSPYSFRGYAACSDCWARKVSYWMERLFGVAPTTRYP